MVLYLTDINVVQFDMNVLQSCIGSELRVKIRGVFDKFVDNLHKPKTSQ